MAHRSDDLSACTRRSEIGVSVRDKVALYQRNALKVRDELETLARNEAASLDADTIQALNEPSAGEQRFVGYTCGATEPVSRAPAPRAPDEAETYPFEAWRSIQLSSRRAGMREGAARKHSAIRAARHAGRRSREVPGGECPMLVYHPRG